MAHWLTAAIAGHVAPDPQVTVSQPKAPLNRMGHQRLHRLGSIDPFWPPLSRVCAVASLRQLNIIFLFSSHFYHDYHQYYL